MYLNFFLYRKFIDFFFPKATSHNVYAVRKSTGKAKRRIIIGAHADAAYEMRYIRKGGKPQLVVLVATVGLVFVLLSNLLLVVSSITDSFLVHSNIWVTVAILNSIFLPAFGALLFFINWKCVTDGANDNLSACYAAMSVMKELSENDVRFDNTEVGYLISGSEEAGIRGADAFIDEHEKELSEIEISMEKTLSN